MNIEIANKLLQLRKEKGLSQEALANELGISRQAISKWERAEASPDTDNLIELAKLYGISLDELLLNETSEKEIKENENEETNAHKEYVNIGKDGIHVIDKDGSEVHVGLGGIHVNDPEHHVDVNEEGVFVDGEKKDWKNAHKYDFPFSAIVFIGYIIYGSLTGAWHPAWIVIFLVPIFDSVIECFEKKRLAKFAYPILCVFTYLYIGFYNDLWHPGWVVFLTVPCFYAIANYLDHKS